MALRYVWFSAVILYYIVVSPDCTCLCETGKWPLAAMSYLQPCVFGVLQCDPM